jgi:hypothetical protein
MKKQKTGDIGALNPDVMACNHLAIKTAGLNLSDAW